MEAKIEELKIELNPELKPRGSFEFTTLDSNIISKEDIENAKILSTEKKIYYCSSKLNEAKYISNLEGVINLIIVSPAFSFIFSTNSLNVLSQPS